MKIELRQHFYIESARFLPKLPKNHPCREMHGHSFKITLVLQGETDPKLEWLIDYNEINRLAKPLLAKIDHKVLNKVAGLSNPTTENLCVWIYKNLSKKIRTLKQVAISETRDSECFYPI